VQGDGVKLIEYARLMKKVHLISEAAGKGSISLKVDDDHILMSPSKLPYETLGAEQLNTMNVTGDYSMKNSPASRDSSFHAAIYRNRSDVGAVVHTHSPYATALALAGKSIPLITLGMFFHLNGAVAIAPFAGPKDPRLQGLVVEYLGKSNAVLLQNHGVVCVGKNIEICYENAVFMEDLCKSYVHALQIGAVNEIQPELEE